MILLGILLLCTLVTLVGLAVRGGLGATRWLVAPPSVRRPLLLTLVAVLLLTLLHVQHL